MVLTKTQLAILMVIDKNPRLSHAEIGKICKLPKSVVTYNFNHLLKEGIIKGFATLVDHSSLGYLELRVYINLYKKNIEQEQQFIAHLTDMKNSGIVVLCTGDYDLIVSFYVKNFNNFWNQWFDMLKLYRSIIKDYVFNIVTQKSLFPFFSNFQTRTKNSVIVGYREKKEIDSIDIKLLSLLNHNCLRPLFEIANILNLTSSSVIYRIRNLEKKEIILGYYTIFDFSKIKKEFCRVQFKLEEIKQMDKFFNYLKFNEKVIGFSKLLGSFNDLEVDLLVENIDGLLSLIKEIRINFPGFIRDYRYLRIIETHKWNHNPEAEE